MDRGAVVNKLGGDVALSFRAEDEWHPALEADNSTLVPATYQLIHNSTAVHKTFPSPERKLVNHREHRDLWHVIQRQRLAIFSIERRNS